MKKKICICGYGYVGRAFYEFFNLYNHYEVLVYDNDTELNKKYSYVENDSNILKEADLIVICVPTPMMENGAVNISIVDNVLSLISSENKLVLIKSTIPPLTTYNFKNKYHNLRIVFSPEYIGESDYFFPEPYNFNKDVVNTSYFIFGGDREDTKEIINFFLPIAGPVKEYIQVRAVEAELCKYMENSFFATKIIFCNEFNEICRTFSADYNIVREIWLKDPRITKTHTLIYNEDKNFCFGGKCLPKDLSGIIKHSYNKGYRANFLKSVYEANNNIRDNNKKNILMVHRIHHSKNQNINPLYLYRNMLITYVKLESIIENYIKNGYNFGSLKECLEEPNKYFCITFDDGFAEHIDIAKKIIDKYNAKKESLIFSINVGNSIYNKYTGMDIIYELIENGKIDKVFDFFDVEKSGNIYDDIKIIKKRYIKESPNILLDFYNYFSKECSIDNLFLNERQLKELSKIATIASHSIYHRDMTNFVELSKEEMLNSKNELEKLIDEEVYIFNYVEGKNNAQLQNECKAIGYKYALSIKNEINNDFSIGRKDIAKF